MIQSNQNYLTLCLAYMSWKLKENTLKFALIYLNKYVETINEFRFCQMTVSFKFNWWIQNQRHQ
jgi:hypothetical protein